MFGVLAVTHYGVVCAAASVRTEQVEVQLVSASSALAPGATTWLGLRLKHAPGWHTYWVNPGDSGLPTKLKWTLPEGYRADDIDWPTPKRFSVGELVNFGYDGEVLLPVALRVPATAKTGSSASIAVDARWLVCHEECIPGRATLTLDLPVATQAQIDPHWRGAFANARAAQPQGTPLKAIARDTGKQIELRLPNNDIGRDASIDAFAAQTKVVANMRPIVSMRDAATLLTFAKSDYFTSTPDAIDLVLVRAHAPALRVHATFARSDAPPG